jgi:hypothetical protein
MLVSGIGSYVYLGSRQTDLTIAPQKPTQVSPTPGGFDLPGTVFLVQSGAIYRFSAGRFTQLTPADGWTQLAYYPGGLLAVKRSTQFSDVYILNRQGKVVRRLTHNQAPPGDFNTPDMHWSFYPRLSHNEKTLFMSYDKPKFGYDVPLSIWSMPLSKTIQQGTLWTISIDYTGGDIQPLPLASGALIYTKYLYDNGKLTSQIWLSPKPEQAYAGSYLAPPPGPGHGTALTQPGEDCSQPSLSPNGRLIAMICTHETQVSYLALASWNGKTLGPRHNLITNQLVAQPTWAPDSSGIAYLAPSVVGAGFQLWWLPKAAYTLPTPSPAPTPTPTPGGTLTSPVPTPTPSPAPKPIKVKPKDITTNLAFDATSPMLWVP